VNIDFTQYALLSAAVFAIGVYGVLARRHPLAVAMSLGLMFAAPVIALVGFTHNQGNTPGVQLGDALSTMAIVAGTCICSVAFALVVLLWRRTGRADVDALGDVEA
jgi:NADH-quinone oxidoreductase subunit K